MTYAQTKELLEFFAGTATRARLLLQDMPEVTVMRYPLEQIIVHAECQVDLIHGALQLNLVNRE